MCLGGVIQVEDTFSKFRKSIDISYSMQNSTFIASPTSPTCSVAIAIRDPDRLNLPYFLYIHVVLYVVDLFSF